jgi:hypothetical protein
VAKVPHDWREVDAGHRPLGVAEGQWPLRPSAPDANPRDTSREPRKYMMNTIDIAAMTIPERIAALEAVWDSLLECDPGIESPDWHQDILDARRQRMDDPSVQFVSLDELRQALQ